MEINEVQDKSNKKTFIFIGIFALLLIGIGGFWFLNKDTSADDKNTKEDQKTNEKNEKKETEEDAFVKLSKGDFSGIAGEYINAAGDIMKILSNGKIEAMCPDDDQVVVTPEKENGGSYVWEVLCSESAEAGVGGAPGSIYPIGVPVMYFSYNDETEEETYIPSSDTDKIRIYFGHSYPEGPEEIYYKK